MVSFDVNWLAAIVVAITDMVIGSLWYSPVLFGNLCGGARPGSLTGCSISVMWATLDTAQG